jgi:hypothetical protein
MSPNFLRPGFALVRHATIALVISWILIPQLSAQAKLKVLHNFGSPNDGNVPAGPLLLDALNNLYGVTGGGPEQYGYGVAFELTLEQNGSRHEQILHNFGGGSDGGFPWGGLTHDAAGNLYGTLRGDAPDLSGVFGLTRGSGRWELDQLGLIYPICRTWPSIRQARESLWTHRGGKF